MTKTIWGFVKIFTEESHAQQFTKGKLLLRRLSYFRNIESGSEDGRGDGNEAVAIWLQPHDVVITLSAPGIADIEITKADLAGPVSFSPVCYDHLHILCLHAIMTEMPDLTKSDIKVKLAVDDRCLTLGCFAVLILAVPFMKRLKRSIQSKGFGCIGRLVEYYDDANFHGHFEPEDVPFRKQIRFSYQKEYRFWVDTDTNDDNAIIIDVGDISDICKMVEPSELNKLEAHLRAVPARAS